jgi:hypothetical protein
MAHIMPTHQGAYKGRRSSRSCKGTGNFTITRPRYGLVMCTRERTTGAPKAAPSKPTTGALEAAPRGTPGGQQRLTHSYQGSSCPRSRGNAWGQPCAAPRAFTRVRSPTSESTIRLNHHDHPRAHHERTHRCPREHLQLHHECTFERHHQRAQRLRQQHPPVPALRRPWLLEASPLSAQVEVLHRPPSTKLPLWTSNRDNT